jgi:hypothetical protein
MRCSCNAETTSAPIAPAKPTRRRATQLRLIRPEGAA